MECLCSVSAVPLGCLRTVSVGSPWVSVRCLWGLCGVSVGCLWSVSGDPFPGVSVDCLHGVSGSLVSVSSLSHLPMLPTASCHPSRETVGH